MDVTPALTRAAYFKNNPKYRETIKEAYRLHSKGLNEEALKVLSNLPSDQQLFNNLAEKLKDKPVYKTLKQLSEGKITDKYRKIIGLASMMTHTAIECEQGNKEYEVLFESIFSKLYELI